MGIFGGRWRFLRRSTEIVTKRDDSRERVGFAWAPGRQPWLPGGIYVGTAGCSRRATRQDALSVPAVVRGRNLLCSIATLPLVTLDRDQRRVRTPLLDQIDPRVPDVVTLAATIEDLIMEGVAWWQVLAYGWDGRPVSARHIDTTSVAMHPPAGYPISTLPSGLYPTGAVWVLGQPVPAEQMLRFDSPSPPLLDSGRAIRRAAKLAQAAEMYADDPQAHAHWIPADGADPADDEEIRGMLQEYAAARRQGAEAYIPAAVQRISESVMSPADMTLVQLQQRSDLEVANIMGLDPEDLGVNTTSRTYANAVDRRVDQVNQTLGPMMRALTDRLSMDDVTRRGYRVEHDLSRYMQADPATRWSTYQTAIQLGVLTVDEVRAREGLPPLPSGTRPAAPAAPDQQQVQQTRRDIVSTRVAFAAAPPAAAVSVGFAAAELRVDATKRSISGLALPYGQVSARTITGVRYRFARGSLEWPAAVSRVKVLADHDWSQLLGATTRIEETDAGLTVALRIARGPEGDRALELAEDKVLDGLSVGVTLLEVEDDPDEPGVLLVRRGQWDETSLTPRPAFDDARVTRVAASRGDGGPVDPTQQPPAGGTGTDTDEPDTARLVAAVEAFTAALAELQPMPPEQRAALIPAQRAVVREPLVYQLRGTGPSFVRDAWDARNVAYGSKAAEEAMARLRRYGEQTAELQRLESERVVGFANEGNTTDQAQIIPPGYRPDLYVGQVPQGRPLYDAIGTKITLSDATSFTVPVWVGSSGLSGENTEGTGPSGGTITNHTYRTVTPTAQSGEFVVTRELMDSSNPAIDVIAMNAMREEYAQDTEGVIATALAAATDNDTGSGQSTEGCYVYTVVGDGADLAVGIREMEGEFPGHRFLTPDRMLASSTGYPALTKAVDGIGRSLFPFLAPQNAQGTAGRAAATLNVDGLACPNAWSLTAATDDVVLFNAVDILAGESPLLEFKFFEKGGPENVYLNIWGYFCMQILRYTGIHAIAYTGT